MLLRLAEYTGEGRYAGTAEGALAPLQSVMGRAALGLAHWLSALDVMLAPPQCLAVVGDDPGPLLDVVRARFRPNLGVAAGTSGEDVGIALLEGREAVGGEPTAYLCRQFTCERPVSAPGELGVLLGG